MSDEERIFDIEVRALLEAIYLRYQQDFRDYAVSSVRRRMRAAMGHFKVTRLSELQHRVLHDPRTFYEMLQFFTVQVSEMFRDPPYFAAIREHAVPMLETYPSLKIWIAGCSHGEEAWSFAILLHEAGLLSRTMIYATDINPEALRHAESGIYPLDRIAGFSKSYLAAGGTGSLSDYYTTAYGSAKFSRTLRSHLMFADHSLATDSVFSEVQLISCRNVLIYFNRELQDRALGLFREALVRNGYLGLGSRETLQFSSHAEAFEAVDRNQRLYRRR